MATVAEAVTRAEAMIVTIEARIAMPDEATRIVVMKSLGEDARTTVVEVTPLPEVARPMTETRHP